MAQRATTSLPGIYLLSLLYLEPLSATAGAILAYTSFPYYVASLTRERIQITPEATFLGTQLTAAWLVFAFNEAVVLRLVDDLRVWKLLIVGMLISDACTVQSGAQAMGGWMEWIDVKAWTVEDWGVAVGTFPFMLVRVLILLGVGVRSGEERLKGKKGQ